jgi:hypothetical protein
MILCAYKRICYIIYALPSKHKHKEPAEKAEYHSPQSHLKCHQDPIHLKVAGLLVGHRSVQTTSRTPKSDSKLRLDLKEIVAGYGAESLKQAWMKTCKALERVTVSIATKGSAFVPIFGFDDVVGPNNAKVVKELKTKGGFIICNVIPQALCEELFIEQVEFIGYNDEICSWPASSPAIFQHPQRSFSIKPRHTSQPIEASTCAQLFVRGFNCSSEKEQEAQSEPLLYPDALRK